MDARVFVKYKFRTEWTLAVLANQQPKLIRHSHLRPPTVIALFDTLAASLFKFVLCISHKRALANSFVRIKFQLFQKNYDNCCLNFYTVFVPLTGSISIKPVGAVRTAINCFWQSAVLHSGYMFCPSKLF